MGTWLGPGRAQQLPDSPQDLVLQAGFRDAHLWQVKEKQAMA